MTFLTSGFDVDSADTKILPAGYRFIAGAKGSGDNVTGAVVVNFQGMISPKDLYSYLCQITYST
jgi:uncharacterized protein affecting Mg2+/Co2+ transport